MKKLAITLFSLTQLVLAANSQSKTESDLLITKNELVGVWQYYTAQIGSGLGESIQFFSDGRFVYSYNPADDTRIIVKLEGTYRLDTKRLFLTIKSRIQRLGGKIDVGGAGTDEYLFVFDNDSTKKIPEINPKEMDPLLILKSNKASPNSLSIKINSRIYFKVSPNPNNFSQN